jgi:single-strand DNA-binding protein
MASLNKVILIGHLVADPELKTTQTGIEVCSFRIGITRKYKEQDGTYKSDFIDIVAWRKTAAFVTTYFKKGKPICVCGSLQQRSWTAQDGTKRYAVEVLADEVSFVEKSDNASNNTGYSAPAQTVTGYSAPATPNYEELSGDDDLPF